jgi:hypothetical protein
MFDTFITYSSQSVQYLKVISITHVFNLLLQHYQMHFLFFKGHYALKAIFIILGNKCVKMF